MREGLPGTCAGMQCDVLLVDAVSVHPGAHLSKAARREVRAGDELAAIFTAAKHWGYKWSAPEYHQNARAMKLHYKPEFLIG